MIAWEDGMTQDEFALHLRPDGTIDCEFYIQRSRERWSTHIDAPSSWATRRMKIAAALERVLHPAQPRTLVHDVHTAP